MLRAGYTVKMFQVDHLSESSISVRLIDKLTTSSTIAEIDVHPSWNTEGTYFIVLLTETQRFMDATLFMVYIN